MQGDAISKLGSFFGDHPEMLFAAVGFIIFIFLALIGLLLWQRAARARGRSNMMAGLTLPIAEVERMRKEGQLSDEEYKAVRRKVAERTLAATRERQNAEQDLLILQQASIDPDAVRQFLPAELREVPPEESAPAPRPAPRPKPKPRTDETQAGDPLAGLAPAPAAAEGAPKQGELDILLAKGVITAEQYRKLKGIVKK